MAEIIIVGGGVAGLAAGIRAAEGGHDVRIIEKHTKAGGNLTGWDRGGYHIDNCIHWLTGTNPATDGYEMWRELGVLGDGIDVYYPETLYTYEKDGRSISLSRDVARLRRDMLAASPEDAKETERFIAAIGAMTRLCGISGDGVSRARRIEKIRAIPSLARYYTMTAGDLAYRFKSPLLRGFIASLLTEGFAAIALIMVFATFCADNGGIPAGSSCAAAERMAARFRSLGGELICGRAAVRVNIEDGAARSVTLDDGRTLGSDHVIVACDPAAAFGSSGLLDISLMPRALKRRYSDRRLVRFSACQCAFACDTADLPFRSDVIFDLPLYLAHKLRSRRLVVREFSHEPDFAPEGKNVIQTMIFCMENDCRRLIRLRETSPEEYTRYKDDLAANAEKAIAEHYPHLAGKLRLLDVWTPASYKRYTSSAVGSFMSFAFPSGMLPRAVDGRVRGVRGLYLATQWQQAPGGLPIAARVGLNAADAIIRKEKGRVGIVRDLPVPES